MLTGGLRSDNLAGNTGNDTFRTPNNNAYNAGTDYAIDVTGYTGTWGTGGFI